MAALEEVTKNISQAWDLANAAADDMFSYTAEAVLASQSFTSAGGTVDIVLPDSTDVSVTAQLKLDEISADVNDTLQNDIPAAYEKLFKNVLNDANRVAYAYGDGDAGTGDTMALIHGMSEAFNNNFNFGGTADDLQSAANQLANFLSDGLVTNPGSNPSAPYGVPISVEEAIKERAIATVDKEALKAEQEAVAQYAARGFPVPPGMLSAKLDDIRDKACTDKATVSKDIAIDQGKRAFDATGRYLEQFQLLQNQVTQNFDSYLRTVIAARSAASDDMKTLVDSVADLRASIVGLYDYTMKEREVLLREAIAEEELSIRKDQVWYNYFANRINTQANTTIAAAQSLGNMASAAVGTQNTMSRIGHETVAKEST